MDDCYEKATGGDGDHLDQAILRALVKDARLSMAALGRVIGLSRTATLARVRRLEREGVISGYHAAVSHPADASRHVARVGILTDTRDTGRYVRRLAGLDAFREAESVSGSFDLLARFEAPTAAVLDEALDEVKRWPTTIRTTTFVVLRTYQR